MTLLSLVLLAAGIGVAAHFGDLLMHPGGMATVLIVLQPIAVHAPSYSLAYGHLAVIRL